MSDRRPPVHHFRQDDRAPAARKRVRVPVAARHKLKAQTRPMSARDRRDADYISRHRKPGIVMRTLLALGGDDLRESYYANLKLLNTAEERRRMIRAGLWREGEHMLYSHAKHYENQIDWDPGLSGVMQRMGMRLAAREAWARSVGEGTGAAIKYSAIFGTMMAAAGFGAYKLGQHHRAQRGEMVETVSIDMGDQRRSTDAPAAITVRPNVDNAAIIAAARDGLATINHFRYAANTPADERMSEAEAARSRVAITTNNRFATVSAIFTGTQLLHDFGLLNREGTLAAMPLETLAGELVGKSQLESGLSPTVEASLGRTDDRARGAFQLKPDTTFSVLALQGHRLDDIPGLIDPQLRQIIERGMQRLAASPRLNNADFRQRHNIREADVRTARSVATGYNYDDPGRAASHTNLFYAAYELLDEADKARLRAAVVDMDNTVTHGNFSGARGPVLSTVLAAMLADELDLPDTLVATYGFRPFGYISHQAGPRAALAIAARLQARDELQVGSREWNRADQQLRQTIFSRVQIRSNYPVYTERSSSTGLTSAHILPWDRIVARIDGMYGANANMNLPNAAADIFTAVQGGHLRLQQGEHNAVALAATPVRMARAPQRGGLMGLLDRGVVAD